MAKQLKVVGYLPVINGQLAGYQPVPKDSLALETACKKLEIEARQARKNRKLLNQAYEALAPMWNT